MNYHLMKEGYPPLIIKSSDKLNYLYALNQADVGNTEAFVEYLGSQLIWSLQIALKAARGESISEKDDLYKEIEVWKKQLKSGLATSPRRQDKLSMEVYDQSITKLFDRIQSQANTFKDLFLKDNFHISYKIHSKDTYFDFISNELDYSRIDEEDSLENFRLALELRVPLVKKSNARNVKVKSQIVVSLGVYNYSFTINGEEQAIIKNYNEFLSNEEIDELTEILIADLFNQVKKANR